MEVINMSPVGLNPQILPPKPPIKTLPTTTNIVKMENQPDMMKMPCTPEYLAQLLKDRKSLEFVPNVFIHTQRLLDEEINRVRKSLYSLDIQKKPLQLPEERGPKLQKQEKIFVPVKAYPDFNFVGRILGPRGMTAKQLEKETGCKIMVRGKGSMRDKLKEEQNRAKANASWEHLKEELHVLITVEDTEERAIMKLARAAEEIKKLLVPTADGEDELKKKQLMELAILNGTYRDHNANTPKAQTAFTAAPLASPIPWIPGLSPGLSPAGLQTLPSRMPMAGMAGMTSMTAAAAAAAASRRMMGYVTSESPAIDRNSVSPRSVPPPGPAMIPQPMRSPTPAAQAHHHLMASPFLPRVSSQSLLAGGFQMAPPTMLPAAHDASGSIIYHVDPYQLGLAPALLDYQGMPTGHDGAIGPAAKFRRAPMREHPYQRALIDPRAATN